MCKPGKTATAAIYQETISALVDLGPNIQKVELQNGKKFLAPLEFCKIVGNPGSEIPQAQPTTKHAPNSIKICL